MLEIEKPRIETLELSEDGTYGKFRMTHLERGYAITLGNSMRRVLLSTLPGVAVTAIKIDGVVHEFTTVQGIKEDITEIVLNIKGLIAKLHSDGPKTVYIEAEGPGEVTAADIKADSEVEILNKDLHIATLDVDGKLHMELTLNRGRGYVPAEQNKPEQSVIGLIPVDSIFTPVLKSNFSVEDTRQGSEINKNALTLEVWTDGSIMANEAVSMSAKILIEHFELFLDLTEGVADGESFMAEKGNSDKEKVLDMTIEELDLSVRSFNCSLTNLKKI